PAHQRQHARPKPTRRLNDTAPRDLETVALKAMDKAPARRYVTAGGVAADLRRGLGGEPVLARPVGRPAKAWRWAKRHPAVAAAWALTLLAAVLAGLSGGAAWLWQRAEYDRLDAVSARDQLAGQK